MELEDEDEILELLVAVELPVPELVARSSVFVRL
jgi:hypothetical protein